MVNNHDWASYPDLLLRALLRSMIDGGRGERGGCLGCSGHFSMRNRKSSEDIRGSVSITSSFWLDSAFGKILVFDYGDERRNMSTKFLHRFGQMLFPPYSPRPLKDLVFKAFLSAQHDKKQKKNKLLQAELTDQFPKSSRRLKDIL